MLNPNPNATPSDLRRLVVRLVIDVPDGHSQGRVHCAQEESEVDARPRLGALLAQSIPPRSALITTYVQGMQFYNFIFLARSWASDRLHLSKSLSWLARRAEKEDSSLKLSNLDWSGLGYWRVWWMGETRLRTSIRRGGVVIG